MALDVYGLTKYRDAGTINLFLDEYVDRVAMASRGGDELLLEPLAPQSGEDEEWEAIPSVSIAHILEVGLAYPRRAFTAYFTSLTACQEVGIERAILGFTRDDQLTLGLSVSTGHNMIESEWDSAETQARALLAHFAEAFHCHLGLILLECPPPQSESEFRHARETLPVNYFTVLAE